MDIRHFQYEIQNSIDNGMRDDTPLWRYMIKRFFKNAVRGIANLILESIGAILTFLAIFCICYGIAIAVHKASNTCDGEKCTWEFCPDHIGK